VFQFLKSFKCFFISCIYDKQSKIIVIKNDSEINLAVIYGGENINDEQLFYGTKYSIKQKTSAEIFGPFGLDSTGGRVFYFFNEDSVYAKIKHGDIKGIVKNTLINKYRISPDSIGSKKVINFPLLP
jgi:hypothetical protein